MKLAIADQDGLLKTSEDEDDIEDAEFAKKLAEDLAAELPEVFQHDAPDLEQTVLSHDDLSMQNILVDEEGKLTVILDRECVSAVPV